MCAGRSFICATGAAQPALEDINRAMLIGQNPAEAVALLSEAQKMVDTKPPAASPAPALASHACLRRR